jgi:hypothetical protein
MAHAFDVAVKDALAFELKSVERRLTTLEVAVDVARSELERIRQALETGEKLEPRAYQ